jgi:hypothetical protein
MCNSLRSSSRENAEIASLQGARTGLLHAGDPELEHVAAAGPVVLDVGEERPPVDADDAPVADAGGPYTMRAGAGAYLQSTPALGWMVP